MFQFFQYIYRATNPSLIISRTDIHGTPAILVTLPHQSNSHVNQCVTQQSYSISAHAATQTRQIIDFASSNMYSSSQKDNTTVANKLHSQHTNKQSSISIKVEEETPILESTVLGMDCIDENSSFIIDSDTTRSSKQMEQLSLKDLTTPVQSSTKNKIEKKVVRYISDNSANNSNQELYPGNKLDCCQSLQDSPLQPKKLLLFNQSMNMRNDEIYYHLNTNECRLPHNIIAGTGASRNQSTSVSSTATGHSSSNSNNENVISARIIDSIAVK